MTKTEAYLLERYKETKWPYYGVRETIFNLGEGTRDELNQLFKAGKIGIQEGINDKLIEILPKLYEL